MLRELRILGRALVCLLAVQASLLLFSPSPFSAQAAPTGATTNEVAANWPGIRFQIFRLLKLTDERLLVQVKVYATPEANAGGTLIGIPVPIPKNATPVMIASGMYRPNPFSLRPAVMTDEQTKETFHTLPPLTTGPQYVSADVVTTLHRGEGIMLTVQFPMPPPPPGQETGRQTVSILLPGAKESVNGLSLPK